MMLQSIVAKTPRVTLAFGVKLPLLSPLTTPISVRRAMLPRHFEVMSLTSLYSSSASASFSASAAFLMALTM